jgi:hypothetical protein
MVGHPADASSPKSVLPCDTAKIWPKTFSDLRGQDWDTLFGTEHAVNIEERECVGHERNYRGRLGEHNRKGMSCDI